MIKVFFSDFSAYSRCQQYYVNQGYHTFTLFGRAGMTMEISGKYIDEEAVTFIRLRFGT